MPWALQIQSYTQGNKLKNTLKTFKLVIPVTYLSKNGGYIVFGHQHPFLDGPMPPSLPVVPGGY